MLTEELILDKIEIVNNFKNIQIKKILVVKKDGQEIASSAQRIAYSESDDISSESEMVKLIAKIIWPDKNI